MSKREEVTDMRITKAMVSDIVQAARCKDCGENYNGAMMLEGSDIVCASCNYTHIFA
jgi:formylmethanofuran dehydrogenase subunit E